MYLQIIRQKLNLVIPLLLVLFHPIIVNVHARGRGDNYPNLALGKEAYMVRLQDNLPPASNGNDGNLATAVRSTSRTIDAYWEVDLGQEYAVELVRIIPDNGFEDRMTHTVLRLFDQEHTSVYSRHMNSTLRSIFEIRCNGPRRARYVRVGLENKERSTPTGASSWDTYIGIKEVEVFGKEPAEIGLFSFDASASRISAGESVTLNWLVADITELNLYPDLNIGPLHSLTDIFGAGSITLFPDRSVEYLLVAENTFGVYVKAVTVIVDDEPLPVRINEIMAQNSQTLRDGYGDTSDWIELHNPSDVAAEMAGCGLSDKPDNPMKWIFPDVNIPPHGYLIVFASGDKELDEPNDPEGYLHTNWKLDSDGESVVLTAPDGVTVLDAIVDYPAQRGDLAYGWDMQENLTFLELTPGSINRVQSYQGWLHPPVFSHERGFYERPVILSIENTDSNARMLISMDDSLPDVPVSSLFSLQVAETLTIRVSVEQDGYKSPEIATHSYLFVTDVISSSVMNKEITGDSRYISRMRKGLLDLPTFIVSVPEIPDDYIEREASLEILWPDSADAIQLNCGFARYGGAWTNFAKKNYKLKFRKIYGPGKLRAPLFDGFDHGIPAVDEFDTLELRGGSHDMNARGFYMAPCFVEDSMLDMESLNPHGRFVHLYINSTYWGQFYLRERLDDNFLASYLKGGTQDYFNVRGNDNVGDRFIPGTPDPMHRHVWDDIRAMRSSYKDISAYVDVPNLIDFMLLWFYGNSETEYRCAGPVNPGPDFTTGFKFWIADSDGFLRTGAMGRNRTSNDGPSDMFGMLVTEGEPDFMSLLENRISMHLSPGGALSPESNTARLAMRMAEIQDSLIAECARWDYQTPDSWIAAAENIYNNLFSDRTSQLLGYLRARGWYTMLDPPGFNQAGGNVDYGFKLTMSANAGTIYYTLNGGDPRLENGDVSPDAMIYTPSGSRETLIAPGSTWRYWDKGTFPADTWHTISFDDMQWPVGSAQLGYGDGDEATTISFGRNSQTKHLAYYFRRLFTVTDLPDIDSFDIELVRDDGAVVYLNGAELFRSNMPSGDITASTTASAGVGGADESQWFSSTHSPEHLFAGENSLAAEVHQIRANSSDISFDLEISALRLKASDAIVLHNDTVVKARAFSAGRWSPLSEAHFTINR